MTRVGHCTGVNPPGLDRRTHQLEGNQQLKALREAINTPIATGETMFALESFQELIDKQAVDIVHPDMATSGGDPRDQENWGLCGGA